MNRSRPEAKSNIKAVDGKIINEVKDVTESTSNIDIGKTGEGISKGTYKVQTGAGNFQLMNI